MGCSVPDTTPIQQWRHVEEGAYAADISTDGTLAVVSGVNNGVNVWRELDKVSPLSLEPPR